MADGRVKRLRWWHWLFDRQVRRAAATAKAQQELQVVDYTDAGVAITMPVGFAYTWNELPLEVRTAFMADVDRARSNDGPADGLHEWRK